MSRNEGDEVLESFEQSRLYVFAAHGFDGASKRIPDQEGRATYAVVRRDEEFATVLITRRFGGRVGMVNARRAPRKASGDP